MSLIIPEGYKVTEEGILKQGKKDAKGMATSPTLICSTNVEISNVLYNVETKEISYNISFNGTTIQLTGEEVATRRGILKLAGYGVKITERYANDLSEYLIQLSVVNTIPTVLMYDTFGWKGDKFVLGNILYSDTGKEEIVIKSKGTKTVMDAVHPSGTVANWIDGGKGLMKYDTQRFCMYTATEPVFLRILNGNSHCYNFDGESSRGKTTIVSHAMSMYGNPYDISITNATTKTNMEVTAYSFNDLPVFYDDVQEIKGYHEIIDDLVYMLSNGKGKGRSNKSITLQGIKQWKTIALFTSEAPILSDKSKTGEEMRVKEIEGGLGAFDKEAVEVFNDSIKNNYGTFAPLLIEYIIRHKEAIINKHKEFREILKTKCNTITNTQEQSKANRFCDMYAITLTAGYVFEEVYSSNDGEKADYSKIIIEQFDKDCLEKTTVTYTEKGLNFIMGWIAHHKSYFLKDGTHEFDGYSNPKQYKIYGNIIYKNRDDEIVEYYDIITNHLTTDMEKAGFDAGRIFSDLKKLGITKTDNGRNTFQTYIEKEKIRVYRIIAPEYSPPTDNVTTK